jgi:hypothetical protein
MPATHLALQAEQRILLLRGQKVMLDFHPADLYSVETRDLKQAVRRNPDRFPADFMFGLNADEVHLLVSLNVIPGLGKLGGATPMAFTEQGVAMLSSVLRGDRAGASEHRHHSGLCPPPRDAGHQRRPRPQAPGNRKEIRRPVPHGVRRHPATHGPILPTRPRIELPYRPATQIPAKAKSKSALSLSASTLSPSLRHPMVFALTSRAVQTVRPSRQCFLAGTDPVDIFPTFIS